MAQQRTEHRMDERLAALLEVEQKLEAQVRRCETVAREQVEAAQAEVLAARSGHSADLEEAAAAEARLDEAAHAAALAAIQGEQRATLARFEQVDDAQVDRLARRALARAMETTGGPS